MYNLGSSSVLSCQLYCTRVCKSFEFENLKYATELPLE